MARLFDNANTDWLYVLQAVIASFPFAVVCWGNPDQIGITHNLMTIGDKDNDTNYHRLVIASSNLIYMNSNSSTAGGTAITSTSVSINTWHHFAGIVASATDRRVFLDGGGKGTQASAVTPLALDRTTIGVLGRQSLTQYFSGMIAEMAVWDLTNWPGATGADKADNFEKILPSLVVGFSPIHFPLGLVAYWPLIRGLNDKVGGYNLTADGPTVSDHPRIILPHGPQ